MYIATRVEHLCSLANKGTVHYNEYVYKTGERI